MVTRALKTAVLLITVILPVIVFAAQLKCTRVTDGDTIAVVVDGQKHTIRLVGIDAPEMSRKKHEPGQPFSQSSTKYLAGLVLNKHIDLVPYGTDRYGRTLGGINISVQRTGGG